MITSTSLKSDSFLVKVMKGGNRAMGNAWSDKTTIGTAPVLNAKGQLALTAVFRAGYSMEFIDADDNDVTEAVMSALREFYGYKTFH